MHGCVNDIFILNFINQLLIRQLKFTRYSVENNLKKSKRENKKNSKRSKAKRTLERLWKSKKLRKTRRYLKNLMQQLPSQIACNITRPLDYLKKLVRFVSSAKNKRTRLIMIFLLWVITIIMQNSIHFKPIHKLHTSKTKN